MGGRKTRQPKRKDDSGFEKRTRDRLGVDRYRAAMHRPSEDLRPSLLPDPEPRESVNGIGPSSPER